MLHFIQSLNPSLDNLQANLHQMNSHADTTIWGHHPSGGAFDVNRSFVKGSNIKFYPKNLTNVYVSWFFDKLIALDIIILLIYSKSTPIKIIVGRMNFYQKNWTRVPITKKIGFVSEYKVAFSPQPCNLVHSFSI